MSAAISCQRSFPPVASGDHVIQVPTVSGDSTLAIYSVPNEYSPGRSWPILIVLHGHGDVAAAFHELWRPVTDSMGFVLLTPQGDVPVSGAGWGWSDQSEHCIRSALDHLRSQVNVDSRKIFIGGFSAGGSLAYRMGMKYAHIFAGIVALSAAFPAEPAPQNSIMLQGKPVFIGHGGLEPEIGSQSRKAKTFFERLGCRVHFEVYENIGHGLPEPKHKQLACILTFVGE